MDKSNIVVIADISQGLQAAFDAIFAPYGGVKTVIGGRPGTILIKPNGIHYTPHTFTNPLVVEALFGYLRDHGYKRLGLMEGCTNGNFTRLVFRVTGYDQICKRFGAKQIYLDEGPVTQVDLRDGSQVRISKYLYDQVVQRGDNFYLNLPKLKTHSMATVTLGVKNQQAFPVADDRMSHHTHLTLHRRLASLYALTQPNFCIIEGLIAVHHGHMVIQAYQDQHLALMNLLVGGADTLAVDVVGARILGYELEDVEHLRICAEWGLGQGDLKKIDIRGLSLDCFTHHYPHTTFQRINPQVRWVVGREAACMEGCKGNSIAIQEMLYNDYQGKGGWTLICGKGFRTEDLEDLPGDILVIGPCACEEVGGALHQRYPRRRIWMVPAHNDLMLNTRYQAKLSGVPPLALVPLKPWVSAWLLLVAQLHGLKARVPPITG